MDLTTFIVLLIIGILGGLCEVFNEHKDHDPELDETDWGDSLGCDEKANQEDIDQAFES